VELTLKVDNPILNNQFKNQNYESSYDNLAIEKELGIEKDQS
jgi:hypothetical protein